MWLLAFPVCLLLCIHVLRREDPSLSRVLQVVRHAPVLEQQLGQRRALLGEDYAGYRNHVYRVLSYALFFLEGDAEEKEMAERYRHVIETALVYHDLGLWTDKQLSYLEPSALRAREAVEDTYSQTEKELLHNIIYWHHKITPFEGENAAIVNAVRKADWIDATMSLVNFGMPSTHVNKVTSSLAEDGFHVMLMSIGPRYYGYDVVRIITELSSILKW
jgi:hypothetical protein